MSFQFSRRSPKKEKITEKEIPGGMGKLGMRGAGEGGGRIDWIFLLNHSRSRRSSLAFNENSLSVQRARTSLLSIASLYRRWEKMFLKIVCKDN